MTSTQVDDHLGFVRAVVSKMKFMETATLENLPAAQHALELASFANLGTAQQDMLFNVTPGGSHTARLNPLDTYTNDLGYEQKRAIGPAKSLRVKAGDVVEMEVYARYQVPASNSTFITGLAGLVNGSLSFVSAGETATAFHAINNLLAGGSLVPNNGDNVPKAYLQYLLFDDNFAPLVGSDCNCYTRVTSDANNAFEKLVLSVEIREDGYLYTYVANESTENINVWFDDFTVTHLGLDVLQSTSYYPFGGLAENVQKEKYRFGYQGQFAEKDEETGFNHFESRKYDAIIGRWLSVDPARQYYSGYIGMGNTPLNGVDPDGELFGNPNFGNNLKSFFFGGDILRRNGAFVREVNGLFGGLGNFGIGQRDRDFAKLTKQQKATLILRDIFLNNQEDKLDFRISFTDIFDNFPTSTVSLPVQLNMSIELFGEKRNIRIEFDRAKQFSEFNTKFPQRKNVNINTPSRQGNFVNFVFFDSDFQSSNLAKPTLLIQIPQRIADQFHKSMHFR